MCPLSWEDKTILSLKETEKANENKSLHIVNSSDKELPLFYIAVQRADITMIDVSFQIRGILQNLGRQTNDFLNYFLK